MNATVATITAGLVKELRDKTGAGMMDCKKALEECGGDLEAAKDWLRKRGQAIADKKAVRTAKDGLIYSLVTDGGRVGVILELNCETDFVARNEKFIALCGELARQIAAGGPGAKSGSLDEFLDSPYAADPKVSVREAIKALVGSIGENIGLARFTRVEASDGAHLQTYIHPPGKLGVMLTLETGKAETKARPEFQALAADLAMHVAAAAPDYLDRNGVPAEALEREKAIYREQAINEGKPEQLAEKISAGRLGKFYQQVCLLEQEFVRDGDFTIQKLLEKFGKELGDTIRISQFHRMKVGG